MPNLILVGLGAVMLEQKKKKKKVLPNVQYRTLTVRPPGAAVTLKEKCRIIFQNENKNSSPKILCVITLWYVPLCAHIIGSQPQCVPNIL